MPQLNPEFYLSQIFWLILTFGLIYLFVSKFFLPKIGSLVDLRNTQIKDDIKFSEDIIVNYTKLEDEALKIVEDAKDKAFTIIEAAAKQAEVHINERIVNVDRDIGLQAAKAEEKLVRSKRKMQDGLQSMALDLKAEIIEKLNKTLKIDKLNIN